MKKIKHKKSKNKSYIGYCHHKAHRGFITKQICEEHHCFCKSSTNDKGEPSYIICKFFEIYYEHPYCVEKLIHMMKKPCYKIQEKFEKMALEMGILISHDEAFRICRELCYNQEKLADYLNKRREGINSDN